jgi:hypothetical protein
MFSIVVPSKSISNLLPCIAAIRKYELTAPIIVVDDGLAMRPQGISIIPGFKPFVFSRNINAGVRHAIELNPEVEGFILCNDDALLESPNGFTLLYETWKQNPIYGCIGATTNLTGQELQWRQNVGLREVPHIAYVCVFVPRSTFENIQWMDTRYCIDYGVDDRDHCEAITRAGFKVGVHDGCYVDHGSLRSSFRGNPHAGGSFIQNYELFKAKWNLSA